MSSVQQPPTREVDVSFLVFVERYATDLLRWDILTFFANNPTFQGTAAEIAQHMWRGVQSVRPELGDLTMLGILEKAHQPDGEIAYQLTSDPDLHQLTLKFADPRIVPPTM